MTVEAQRHWWRRRTETERPEHFDIETRTGSPELRDEVLERFIELHHATYRDMYSRTRRPLTVDYLLEHDRTRLAQHLADEESHVIMLHPKGDTARPIVGFLFVYPASKTPEVAAHRQEAIHLGYTSEEYRALQDRTAEYGVGVIDPAYRGQNGFTQMMDEADRIVRADERFTNALLVSVTANGLAKSHVRRYRRRNFVYKRKIQSEFGEQEYARVRVNR